MKEIVSGRWWASVSGGRGALSGDIMEGKLCRKDRQSNCQAEHWDGTKRKSGADYSGGAEWQRQKMKMKAESMQKKKKKELTHTTYVWEASASQRETLTRPRQLPLPVSVGHDISATGLFWVSGGATSRRTLWRLSLCGLLGQEREEEIWQKTLRQRGKQKRLLQTAARVTSFPPQRSAEPRASFVNWRG